MLYKACPQDPDSILLGVIHCVVPFLLFTNYLVEKSEIPMQDCALWRM
jgi:hypothetical protein